MADTVPYTLDAPFPVEVIRSARRRKTASARMRGGGLEVRVPDGLTLTEERRLVERLVGRTRRRLSTERFDLEATASRLARRLDLPQPRSIRWVDNQTTRWGSCTVTTGDIRLSSRLAAFPDWVVEYVVVHELAHLVEASHDDRFWALVARYPLAERARGFLIAKGMDDAD